MSWTNKINTQIIILFSSISVVYGASLYFRNVGLVLVATGMLISAIMFHFQRITSFAISAVALCFSLAAAEFVAPLFFKNEKHVTEYVFATKYWGMSDLGGNPGIHRIKKQTVSGETIYDVKYSIGENGFRITQTGNNEYRRINFFGDSFTFGEGLNDNETLPYFINQTMRNISVRNFGFSASGVHQALAILESERDTKGAINFLLTSPYHAVRSSCKPTWTAGAPKYEIQSDGVAVRVGNCPQWSDEIGVFRKVLNHSTLYSLAQEIWRDSTTDADFELYFAIVKRIGEISRDRHQTFIIGFIKAEEGFFKGSTYANQKCFAKLREISDEIIDLTLSDKTENLDARYFIHTLDKHPSALANIDRATMLVDTFNRHLR